MKVEYVEPFVEAACSVLSQVSGGKAAPQPLGMLGTMFSASCVNIVSRVDGSLNGDVVYSMSSLTAKKLAGLLLGTETHSFGRLMGNGLSCLGEMLASQTDSLLSNRGLDCHISRPTVFQGMNVEFSSSAPALAVPIDTEVGRIDVKVAVRNDE